jgi:hypothetical protein
MDTAQLTMLFSEPVRQESVVVPLNLELGHEPTSGAVYSLSGGIVLDGDGLVIVINMTHFDMGVIKANPNLFVDADTSIIGMKRAFATDMNGVSVSKLLVSDNVRADRYAADHTKPVLLNFAVDMVNGTIRFNFDEPVNASTLSITELMLQSDSSIIADNVQFTSVASAATDSLYGPHVLVQFTESEMNLIKQFDVLFTSLSTSFVSFNGLFMKDMAENAVTPISNTSALPAAHYANDTVRPVLRSYSVDMAKDPGELVLTFSETVQHQSINLTKISFQSEFYINRSMAMPPIRGFHQLTGGAVETAADDTTLRVTLAKSDFDRIKLERIGTSNDTTWLVMHDSAVLDMAGVGSAPLLNGITAMSAATITKDTTPPRIAAFDLDMDAGKVDLWITEPVNANSLNVVGITFQNIQNSKVAP